MSNNQSEGKICVICGQDCSDAPRFKDDQGRYQHESCYHSSQQSEPPAPAVSPPASHSSLRMASSHSAAEKPRAAAPVVPPRRSSRRSELNMVSLLFSFDGRVSRLQYWLACIGLNFVSFVIAVIAEVTGFLIIGILTLVTLWSMICFNIKRWHDRDKSGFWIFIVLIPVIGWIWAFIEMGILRGTVGVNQYGDDPVG